MDKLFNAAKCFILSIFFVGCTTYGYHFSKPVDENKPYKFYPNGIVLLKLKDIDLFLLPKNNTVFEAGAVIPPIPVVIGRDSPEEFHYQINILMSKLSCIPRKKDFFLILRKSA